MSEPLCENAVEAVAMALHGRYCVCRGSLEACTMDLADDREDAAAAIRALQQAEACPMHSTNPMHIAVRNNRRILGDEPQGCTCPAAHASEAATHPETPDTAADAAESEQA